MFFSSLINSPASGGSSDTSGGGGWISSLLGSGGSSASGQRVTVGSALGLPILQNCVTLLAETVGQLPLELYRRSDTGEGRESARDHPLYPILKHQPNAWQTPMEYREFGQMALGLRGNAYSYIERDGAGRVLGLVPVDPDLVQVQRGANLRPYFRIGSGDPLGADQIHHVRWISLNGYTGISPLQLHANALGYAQAMAEYSGKSFANGTALSGVIERPTTATPIKEQSVIDRLTDAWAAKYSGAGNAKRVALLQDGMTFKPLSMTNVDAELVNALRLSGEDIARIYKMPAPLIGLLDKATYNNVENLQIQFVIYTLMPWLKRHEQAMQRDFLLPTERDSHYIEFTLAGLLRGNQQARFQAYAVGRQWGWLSINDIRRLENMPPVRGGDAYLQPLNMVDATQPLAPPVPPHGAKPDSQAADEVAAILGV